MGRSGTGPANSNLPFMDVFAGHPALRTRTANDHSGDGDPANCIMQANGELTTELRRRDYGRIEQRRRRARILSTARHLFAQRGRDGFALKEVAEICDVSVQTIYNLVGGRSQVMAGAVNEFIEASFVFASDLGHPVAFLELAKVYWMTAATHPGYMRNTSLYFFSSHLEYRQAIQSFVTRNFAQSLGALKRRGYFGAAVDTQALARRFSCMTGAVVYDWAVGTRTLDELRCDLVEGHAALLRSALAPGAVREIDDWLAENHQRPHDAARLLSA